MTLYLASGKHETREEGMCAMEFIAYLAGEPHSDHPECVSPVIATFVRSWNDVLDDETRNRLLRPLLRECLHTNTGPADDETRSWLAGDWLVRVHTPAWLDAAGLGRHATRLRELPPLTTREIANAVQSVVDAAWDAARDAARNAARNAARDAAWAAARDAAWDAAWAAARDAAWDAAWDAARDAAWAAARDAAWDAAWDAARDAAWDAAWAAARDAAMAALQPTVSTLQESAVALLRRMIAVGVRVESRPLCVEADAMLAAKGL